MPNKIDPSVFVAGGLSLPVVLLNGETTTVLVRLLRVAEFAQFFSNIDNAEKLADFICAQQDGWSNGVRPDSIVDIFDQALNLNFDTARRWAEIRAKNVQLAREFNASSGASGQ